MTTPSTPEAFFAGSQFGLSVYAAVRSIVDEFGEVEVRTTKSQVAFRRRRGFAYLWRPGRWLKNPAADVVLSIALDRPVHSPRFKQVNHSSPRVWMHHFELHRVEDVDEEVAGWLRGAYEGAR